jgi:CheY-like chemotaxis protein
MKKIIALMLVLATVLSMNVFVLGTSANEQTNAIELDNDALATTFGWEFETHDDTWFEKNGYTAITDEEGLEKIEDLYSMYKNDLEQNLRVIISDVEMPQMDGFHFAANVRDDKRFSNIPIIFNSSLSNEFSELHGKDAGGDVFLTKFNATEFYKAVSRVIETRKK